MASTTERTSRPSATVRAMDQMESMDKDMQVQRSLMLTLKITQLDLLADLKSHEKGIAFIMRQKKGTSLLLSGEDKYQPLKALDIPPVPERHS